MIQTSATEVTKLYNRLASKIRSSAAAVRSRTQVRTWTYVNLTEVRSQVRQLEGTGPIVQSEVRQVSVFCEPVRTGSNATEPEMISVEIKVRGWALPPQIREVWTSIRLLAYFDDQKKSRKAMFVLPAVIVSIRPVNHTRQALDLPIWLWVSAIFVPYGHPAGDTSFLVS
jgi:hypothetical protein